MFGLLLAMGMGTGKTLVALMLMLERKAKRTLILCPLRVVPVWVTQIEKYWRNPAGGRGARRQLGSVRRKQEIAAEKLRLAEARGVPFVCIVNYDSFWRQPFNEWAEKLRWDLFIMDEAHRIKSPGAKPRWHASGCGTAQHPAGHDRYSDAARPAGYPTV